MSNYYNEIDPFAAAMLRNLIAAGHIAPGIVDERSIEDVRPDELAGYTQCHFFAGVGVWSLALRAAGWPDERRVWTGSCPCQPFSAAGKGDGFADERHLWPAFYHLIAQCRPPEIYGEQVASKAVDPWIDLVHADMEALGYAFGSVPFPSAGVGAPHIRDRNYWAGRLANPSDDGLQRRLLGRTDAQRGMVNGQAGRDGAALRPCESCGYSFDVEKLGRYGCPNCEGSGLADTDGIASGQGCAHDGRGNQGSDAQSRTGPWGGGGAGRPGPTNGLWADADWLLCRDGKWRPVEPGTFPLAHGSPARVGRLRAYGNAINAKAAQAFIESVM
jgi:DNA (cytosine-5)-methyltransferase 1